MRGVTPSVLRQTVAKPRIPTRGTVRFNSTDSAQKKASDALSSAQKNAGKLLESSKQYVTPERVASVKSSAQKLMESGQKFGSGLLTRLGPTGEKIGSLLGGTRILPLHSCCHQIDILFFAAYKQPVYYNLSVARELVKQVYVAESLAPPKSLDALKSAYSTLWSRASSPTYWRNAVANGEVLKLGIYGLEAYGIFKVCTFCHCFSILINASNT